MILKVLGISNFERILLNYSAYCSDSTINKRCWKCQAHIRELSQFPPMCPSCKSLQNLDKVPDYFAILSSVPSYKINMTSLSQQMKQLQKVLHPDLFSHKDPFEQELSEKFSALVNEALSTLQCPIARGDYFLKHKGVNLEPEKQITLDPEFLAEFMELNERLEELSSASEWKKFRSENDDILKKLQINLEKAFDEGDLKRAEQILGKMRYFENLQNKLKDIQSSFNVVD